MKRLFWELSDGFPALMERFERSRKLDWGLLLAARADLLSACETTVENAAKESRGLTPDELRSFDEHRAQIAEINAALAGYKAARIAEHGADMIHLPF